MNIGANTSFHFGFTEFGEEAIEVAKLPCSHPDGHLWAQAGYQLLSNPPQNVYSCVREGCGVVRHTLQRKPPRRLIPDNQLPKGPK